MSCPTCGHTMQAIAHDGVPGAFWCPRCGTVTTNESHPASFVPKLVERCRDFKAEGLPREQSGRWYKIGIAESIHTPEKR